LTLVATLLVGIHVSVYCYAPLGYDWKTSDAYTILYPHGPKIYLQHCRRVVAKDPYWVVVFGHEILHAKHPSWSERRVLRNQQRYSRIVLRALNSL